MVTIFKKMFRRVFIWRKVLLITAQYQLPFLIYLQCAWPCASQISYSNFLTAPWGQNHYPHFTNTELSLRGGSGLPSVTHLVKWKNQGSNLCASDTKLFLVYLIASMGFPRGSFLEAKKLSAKCRRCGFDPWVGMIPWRKKCNPLLGLYS